MTVTMTFPDVNGSPDWAWITAACFVWYVFAAAVIRWTNLVYTITKEKPGTALPPVGLFIAWVFSPLLVLVNIVFFGVGLFASIVLHPPRRN